MEVLYTRGTESVRGGGSFVNPRAFGARAHYYYICYTGETMEKTDLFMILGGTFIIATGLGFYLARIFFGN
jgi:hypothetical protein